MQETTHAFGLPQDELLKIFRISESSEPELVGDITGWEFVALLKLSLTDCFLLSHYGPGTYHVKVETKRGNFIMAECVVNQNDMKMIKMFRDMIKDAVEIIAQEKKPKEESTSQKDIPWDILKYLVDV